LLFPRERFAKLRGGSSNMQKNNLARIWRLAKR